MYCYVLSKGVARMQPHHGASLRPRCFPKERCAEGLLLPIHSTWRWMMAGQGGPDDQDGPDRQGPA
jgi:hypothetical protein